MARILAYEGFGMQTLLKGVIRGISSINQKHEIVLFTDPTQELNEEFGSASLEIIQLPPTTQSTFGKFTWDHISVGRACKKFKIDALYAPAHIRPLYVPCPVVVSVLDMMYHRFPKDWDWMDQAYFRGIVSVLTPRATIIAALSENTKKDILHFLPVSQEKVIVVYPGVPEGFQPLPGSVTKKVRDKYKLFQPIILYIGGFHPRKNISGMIEAFEKIAPEIPHELVITGPRMWERKEILERLQKGPAAHRIRRLGLVERRDLVCLLNEADLFVFPSLYEGFGFPVLEAMACGCAVITSSNSSLTEVGGNGAFYVQPSDSNGLSEAMKKVIRDDELKQALRLQGLEQAKRFSWDKSASQTIALLEQAACSKN